MRGPLPPEKEAQAQQLAHDLAEAAHEDFLRIARTLVGSDDVSLFGDTELKVRDLVLKLAARAYQQHLDRKNGYEGSGLSCPGCGGTAAYHDDYPRTLVRLFGAIRYKESAGLLAPRDVVPAQVTSAGREPMNPAGR